MASSLIQVLQSLREKIDTLNEEVAALRSRNRLLEEDNEVLRRSIRDSEQERDRAKLDAEFLAISHRLAQNPDTIITARRRI
ncbi:MAG: hypothetical protein K2J23_06890, partial [Muribaculaceae bacterium]|nr:hypothetical protein [Muribaculaceae bacterium]